MGLHLACFLRSLQVLLHSWHWGRRDVIKLLLWLLSLLLLLSGRSRRVLVGLVSSLVRLRHHHEWRHNNYGLTKVVVGSHCLLHLVLVHILHLPHRPLALNHGRLKVRCREFRDLLLLLLRLNGSLLRTLVFDFRVESLN